MGKGKLWPSADPKPLNRSSPHLNHVIRLRRGHLPPNKIWAQSVHFFLGSSARLQARLLDGFWRSIRHTTRFCARKCLLGVKNLNLIFNLFIGQKFKKITIAPIGKIKKKFNCHNFGCIQHKFVIFGSKVCSSETANSTGSFKFTSDRPLLPWQRNLRQNWL